MPDASSQSSRLVKFHTTLGADTLLIHKMHGDEGLSRLFCWSVEAFSETGFVSEDEIAGYPCAVELISTDGSSRFFQGICSEINYLGSKNEKIHYNILIRPHFWFLTIQNDSRIFRNKSFIEIVEGVLESAGLTDKKVVLRENYEKIDYCVQYQESNYCFVCRLLERYGAFFFFEFYADRHVLVITDSRGEIKPAPNAEVLEYNSDERLLYRMNVVSDVTQKERITSDSVVVNDYDYENVTINLKNEQSDLGQHGLTGNALYDFRSSHKKPQVGELLAQVALESERAKKRLIKAKGVAPNVFAGSRFSIVNSPLPLPDEELTCIRAEHLVHSDTYRTEQQLSDEDVYRGTYDLIPWEVPFRAPQTTPWPQISGPHTAVVARAANSSEDEEIDVDKHGRILVKFHWDREKQLSCRVRVAQTLAGKGFGTTQIPRVGHEVLVEYIDGNPDRPIVTGTVYNSENKPPTQFPDAKTLTGIMSNVSKGGGGANELHMDDKKDQEKFSIVAERDMSMSVKNDMHVKVGYDKSAPGSYNLEVHQDRVETVSNGSYELGVDTGSRTVFVKAADGLTVEGSRSETIGGQKTETIANAKTVTAKSVEITAEETITISAGTSITLSVGGNTIVISEAGVDVDGKMIYLN